MAGGTFVTITGTNLANVTLVQFGPAFVTTFISESATQILLVSPAGSGAGVVNVTVTNSVGTSATSPSDLFFYTVSGSTPTVTGISPMAGPPGGGTAVTITGTGFIPNTPTAVDFGPTAATNVDVVSATTITADSPAGTGIVDVTVVTLAGTSATSPADQFSYEPTVTSVSPRSGPMTGGTEVTITGTNLANVTAISFGTAEVTNLISASDTQLVVLSPAGSVFGPVNVIVTTSGGTSTASPADGFFYTAVGAVQPLVSSISPKFGSPGGGTLVTITGTGFDPTAAATVYFGASAATSVNVVSTTTITAVSPPGTIGAVNVNVVTLGGTSPSTPASVFTYSIDGPQVTSVKRYGFHSQPTYLVINFNGPLAPSQAQTTSNYQIVGAGHRIRVVSAFYDGANDSVILSLAKRLNIRTTYRLTVNGTAPSGLTNPDGVFLDGAGTGEPGTNYVTSITSRNLAGSASQVPTFGLVYATPLRPAQASSLAIEPTLHKTSVDHLLATESLHFSRKPRGARR